MFVIKSVTRSQVYLNKKKKGGSVVSVLVWPFLCSPLLHLSSPRHSAGQNTGLIRVPSPLSLLSFLPSFHPPQWFYIGLRWLRATVFKQRQRESCKLRPSENRSAVIFQLFWPWCCPFFILRRAFCCNIPSLFFFFVSTSSLWGFKSFKSTLDNIIYPFAIAEPLFGQHLASFLQSKEVFSHLPKINDWKFRICCLFNH